MYEKGRKMEKLSDRKQINRTILLFACVYMVSYMTRINFGAVITAIVEESGMTKTMLSAAITGSSVTYGVGQILSGCVGDRISPKKLVFLGLTLSSAMNLLIPVCRDHVQMAAVWCVNGLAQACMWPPLVRLMVGLFTPSDYRRASTVVSWGSSFGTIAIYLLAPAVITVSGWRVLFLLTAACGVSMALLWLKYCREPEFQKPAPEIRTGGKSSGNLFTPLLAAVMFVIVLQGALRDGVTTWMPSFICETFGLSSEVSILSGVCLPLFSILSFRVALALYERFPGNPVRCAGWIFAAGALSALMLTAVCGRSPAASIACMALLTGCMHGVNMILTCMVPPFFQRHGNISTVSGILNSCTYVGSAVSTYGIALLSESAGWQTTAFVWFAIAAAGAAVCMVCGRIWK